MVIKEIEQQGWNLKNILVVTIISIVLSLVIGAFLKFGLLVSALQPALLFITTLFVIVLAVEIAQTAFNQAKEVRIAMILVPFAIAGFIAIVLYLAIPRIFPGAMSVMSVYLP